MLPGVAGAPEDVSGAERDGRGLVYVVVGALALLLVAIVIVSAFVGITILGSGGGEDEDRARAAQLAKLPPYWTVRRGDTYAEIARRTGLKVEELQAFNPRVDPSKIRPGQRLNLRADPPKPKPKPLGPRFYTLRSGDTFSAISARTGHSVARLQRLNPKLSTTALKPGQRVRLRR